MKLVIWCLVPCKLILYIFYNCFFLLQFPQTIHAMVDLTASVYPYQIIYHIHLQKHYSATQECSWAMRHWLWKCETLPKTKLKLCKRKSFQSRNVPVGYGFLFWTETPRSIIKPEESFIVLSHPYVKSFRSTRTHLNTIRPWLRNHSHGPGLPWSLWVSVSFRETCLNIIVLEKGNEHWI